MGNICQASSIVARGPFLELKTTDRFTATLRTGASGDRGEHRFKDGSRYTGALVLGAPEGQGKMFMANGEFCIGTW